MCFLPVAPLFGLQEPPELSREARPSLQDSADLRSQARRAQREFEVIHRYNLTHAGRDWFGGGCDEQIGRICLRFQGEDDWEPVEEDQAVTEAREALLGTLAEIGRAIPGDRWVLGQRIRYLGDVGRWAEAEVLAGGCVGEPSWWCHALLGYVHHRGGRPVEAMEAFDTALAVMDPDQAREWMDPSILLDYTREGWLSNPGPRTREEATTLFWRLADPLFLTPGNERLTEHLSRRFGSTLYDNATSTIGLSWGRGLQELLVRYGFAAGWERSRPRMGEMAGGSVVEHHHPDSRGLLPPVEALENPGGLPEDVWVPQDERPVSASAPVRAPLVAQGMAQTAVLRRGGTLLVVAAYGVPTDTVLLRRRPNTQAQPGPEEDRVRRGEPPLWEPSTAGLSTDTLAGLYLLADTGSWAPHVALGSGGEGVLAVQAPPGGYLLSQELWNPSGRWGARVRHGVRAGYVPPDVPTVSELFLLESGEDLPQELEEALPRMLPSTRIPGGRPVTVAWEVYGLGPEAQPLTFSMSLVEEGGGTIRRALSRIGLFRRPPVLTVSWTEAYVGPPGPYFRALDLDLPPLEPGRYVVRLEMELPYRGKVLSNRRLTVF